MSVSDMEYARKKVYWALARMAVSDLPPRDRLMMAAHGHLHPVFALLDDPAELSPEAALLIAALHHRLTDRGSYHETVAAMREGEIHYVICELLNLHRLLAQEPDEEEPPSADPHAVR